MTRSTAETPIIAIIPDILGRRRRLTSRETQGDAGDRKLNPTNLIPAAQSDALLQEIEQQTREECRALATAAEREAAAIVGEARTAPRGACDAAIEELRREGARRLARAKAQIETEARQRAQQSAVEAIARAWPLLVEALVARWRDPATRAGMDRGVARSAHDRLRANTWMVEHPGDWSAEEQRSFAMSLGAGEAQCTFAADRELTAGLRISAGEATSMPRRAGCLRIAPHGRRCCGIGRTGGRRT